MHKHQQIITTPNGCRIETFCWNWFCSHAWLIENIRKPLFAQDYMAWMERWGPPSRWYVLKDRHKSHLFLGDGFMTVFCAKKCKKHKSNIIKMSFRQVEGQKVENLWFCLMICYEKHWFLIRKDTRTKIRWPGAGTHGDGAQRSIPEAVQPLESFRWNDFRGATRIFVPILYDWGIIIEYVLYIVVLYNSSMIVDRCWSGPMEIRH